MESWTFEAELWSSESVASWVFLTLPPEVDDDVRLRSGPPAGFGSVRVEVSLGTSTWRTSVFPDKARGYVLPVKAAVRRREGLEIGDRVGLTLSLVTDVQPDADMVILLRREDLCERESTRPGEADLIVAKHRNGPTRDITVAFQGHYSRFVGMAH